MHTFQQEWPDDLAGREPVSATSFIYRDATDVVKYAAKEPLTTWYTWPEVWHLDGRGRWRCGSKGSSLDSVRRFAERPEHVVECRRVEPRRGCPNNWVILEPRHPGRSGLYEVNDVDTAAFTTLRLGLSKFGVTLLDVVVFDQEHHWWSLHEMTSGTTQWVFEPPRTRGGKAGRR
jgi:hypothetical protein